MIMSRRLGAVIGAVIALGLAVLPAAASAARHRRPRT
jgi:hypothetical protein